MSAASTNHIYVVDMRAKGQKEIPTIDKRTIEQYKRDIAHLIPKHE